MSEHNFCKKDEELDLSGQSDLSSPLVSLLVPFGPTL